MTARAASRHPSPPRAHWWSRLVRPASGNGPWGLDDRWHVVHLRPRHDLVLGEGGVFLVTQGIRSVDRVRAEAARLAGWLTSRLGRPVSVHGVLAVPPTDPQPLDQPMDVTIVSVAVLGAWLRSHPQTWSERELAGLVRASRSGLAPGG